MIPALKINGQEKVIEGIDLKDTFDQVWVINLKRRPERLERFWAELEKGEWPFRTPKVFAAIDGAKVGVPRYWRTGAGSYGCLRSHMSLLERAIMDEVGSILVLEDDAVFRPGFKDDVTRFLREVPEDWQCLMLGGQHVNSFPIPLGGGVVRAGGGGGIHRTHCYGLRGMEVMKALYKVWANSAVHCDWVMGPSMARFKTYAPDPFLVGQAEGKSDISGGMNPAKFWRPPSGTEPVVILHAPREVMESLRARGFHTGYSRDPATGVDTGLRDLFRKKKLSEAKRNQRLQDWIRMIQWEALSMTEPGVCTIWHHEVTVEMVKPLVRGRVVEVLAGTLTEALAQIPDDLHEGVDERIRVALVRAERKVVEALRKQGWHNGYWINPKTGRDRGVERILKVAPDRKACGAGLRCVARTLFDEAARLVDGVPMFWHDDITVEMLQDDGIEVVEINAATPEEALEQWNGVLLSQ